jgi:fatty acid desaturase
MTIQLSPASQSSAAPSQAPQPGTPHSFSISAAKSLVKDLSRPVAWVYWTDFLATITVGHAAFGVMLRAEQLTGWEGAPLWTLKLGLFAVVAITYMRATMFIHELVHLPHRGFRAFRVAWNLLCGIPFLIPSFLYYPHVDHHRRKHYGTDHDGEYLDLSHRHPAHVLLFIGAAFIVPVAAFLRFAVMSPIAWVLPGFRSWVERHASSMVVDVFYLRGDFGPQARRIMRLQEVACFAWCLVMLARAPIVSGQWVDGFLVHAYAVSVTLILINNVRTLGAHRWVGDGRELSFEEQLLDSVNYPYRPWITELWGPTGTRYHALHHLFPSIPYHNLGRAHRRLAAGLPADSLYHATVRVSLIGAIVELWQRASQRVSTADQQHSGSQRSAA